MLRTKAVLKCRTAVAIKGEIMGILIENLSFHYTGTPVLEQVNLEVKDGDYVILTGENGSGKSTFLKLLLGELKAQEGSITVNGKDISATFGKGDLGYVPQNSISRNQNFPATVEEIMMTGVYSSSWKARFQVKKEIPRKPHLRRWKWKSSGKEGSEIFPAGNSRESCWHAHWWEIRRS